MKILHINAVYGVGSTGVIVEDLHNISQLENIESYVAYSYTNKKKINNGYYIKGNVEKKIHALMTRITGKQGYYSYFSTKSLIKYLKKIKPDIVHLHNLHSNFINIKMLLSYLAKEKIATVVTLHDCWFYTGGCFHYTSVKCDKWKQECGRCPNNRNEIITHLKDNSSRILRDRKRYFDKIDKLYVVGVSKWIIQEAVQTVFKNSFSTHIYNGIDLDFFRPVNSEFRQKYGLDNLFLILGMANKFFLSINASTFNVIVKGLKPDERLVILGCSEKQMLCLPSNVIGLPYINDRKKLRDIYCGCDIFVNCSREESLSLVNIEAQACGLPVITYSNTGVKETVDGSSSFAVETGDSEEIIRIIRRYRSNTDTKTLKTMCREWVNTRFNKAENYKEYIRLYKFIYESVIK